jgi:TolA-binding protein
MLAHATDMMARQDYAGAIAYLEQLREKFPSTAAAGQAKKIAEKLKIVQGEK